MPDGQNFQVVIRSVNRAVSIPADASFLYFEHRGSEWTPRFTP